MQKGIRITHVRNDSGPYYVQISINISEYGIQIPNSHYALIITKQKNAQRHEDTGKIPGGCLVLGNR